jgi:hypothetical protein
MPTNGSPKAAFGPSGGLDQWNQRCRRLNVRNGPFLELTPYAAHRNADPKRVRTPVARFGDARRSQRAIGFN